MPPINWASVLRFLLPYLIVAGIAFLAGSKLTNLADEAAGAATAKAHAEQVQGLNNRIHELELVIADVNTKTAEAKARTEAAEQARAQAEQHAADLAAFSKGRMDRLDAVVKGATSCKQVLDGYWEQRR